MPAEKFHIVLGVDTGGTFTDFVLLENDADGLPRLRTHKAPSTSAAPEQAILQGIEDMGLSAAVRAGKVKIIHGSTVATNAALEGKGVETAFVTNRGFGDLLAIARQTRPQLYRLENTPVANPVPRELCFETGGRLGSKGEVLDPLSDADMERLAAALAERKPAAIAIAFLFSFLDKSHETRLAQYLERRLDWRPFITCSSFVLPEYREYERSIATWLNAALGPLVRRYLLRLKAATEPAPLAVMQSSGGTIDAAQAADKSVNLLLSGPAGGLAAARSLSQAMGEPRLMTFDMGGTSTDVALLNGEIALTSEGKIGEFPLAIPMVDMHTIGAGGGSIAIVDEGGLLQVGPQSAGAEPGPACYGRGGCQATVTDANLVLGRLQAEEFMGGRLELDASRAKTALGPIAEALGATAEEAAAGIVRVANERMARALRVISVERGHDPNRFQLCCFGGAGGLHVCALAEAMGMRKAMVPIHAGVLSAMGMLLAPVERRLSITCHSLLDELDEERLKRLKRDLVQEGLRQLAAEGVEAAEVELELSADLRYAGQSACLNVAWEGPGQAAERFHKLHETRYGHRLAAAVELVNIRVAASYSGKPFAFEGIPRRPAAQPVRKVRIYGCNQAVPVFHRQDLGSGAVIQGPALITEASATSFLAATWSLRVDEFGNLMLAKNPPSGKKIG